MAATSILRSADIRPTSSQNFYSVDNSPQTPPSANNSPTNLYSHLKVRQLRPPKQPLYTPACLRPTEALAIPTTIPDRPRAPDTPPESQESSFESSSALASANQSPVRTPVLSSPVITRSGFGQPGQEIVFDETVEVTGPPTIAHWKPDASASSCSICKTTFTWYFRRHHCRRCGDLVCASHFLRTVPLDQNARLHHQGIKSKACDTCFRDWQTIRVHSRSSSIADSQSSRQGSLHPPVAVPRHVKNNQGQVVGSMARSEGMVWSTF